jgi:hypothetical protein
MEFRDYLDGKVPFGETFPVDAGTNGNGNGCEADPAIIRKMLQPVHCNGFALPVNGELRKLCEMAWSCDPETWDTVSEWSYEAILKMREPTYQGWRIQMSPASLTRLLEYC